MITIFTIPKPFTDPHIRVIQRNAIQSWLKLHPSVEVILLGNDAGVAETAAEFGITHIAEVKLSEWGTPLINSAFGLVSQQAKHDILVYVNADIIFTQSLLKVLNRLPAHHFLLVGRRQDLDVTEPLNFNDAAWESALVARAHTEGKLHSVAGMDYFMFRKNTLGDLPPLIVGRVNWDSWMIWNARTHNLPIIDATKTVFAIHQNHGYTKGNNYTERKANPEGLHNDSFIPDRKKELSIAGANWIMQPNYALKRNMGIYTYPLKRLVRKLIGK